jgi:hypothetical protein
MFARIRTLLSIYFSKLMELMLNFWKIFVRSSIFQYHRVFSRCGKYYEIGFFSIYFY